MKNEQNNGHTGAVTKQDSAKVQDFVFPWQKDVSLCIPPTLLQNWISHREKEASTQGPAIRDAKDRENPRPKLLTGILGSNYFVQVSPESFSK